MCYFRKSPQVTIIFVAAEVTGGPLRSAARAELRVRETRKSDTEEQDRMLWISTAIYCSLCAFLKERRRVESWKKWWRFSTRPDRVSVAGIDDEAHFWLNGYVNKQNCRIWSEANPQVYVETPLHPDKLTVWWALCVGGILLQKR
ncbi:hypothetical protein TNCV_1627671 [Trichonephila clavipes]|nr:hypothetical protein TNCV_1627671 [Trichonephila clavipes]